MDARVGFADVKAEIGRLAPFLLDQKSTTRYTTAREAYSSVWEKIGQSDVSHLMYSLHCVNTDHNSLQHHILRL
jgi:hypothetical protein